MGKESEARDYLKYLCKHLLMDRTTVSATELDLDQSTLEHLKEVVDSYPLLRSFLDFSIPAVVSVPLTKLLYMLVHTGDISAVFPFQYHNFLEDLCSAVLQGKDYRQYLSKLDPVCLELKTILQNCTTNATLSRQVASFVCSLLEQTRQVHSQDHDTDPISIVPSSYNSPSGAAYYFTDSGEQLLRMPDYQANTSRKQKLSSECTKLFPQVSYGGFGHLMAFFCPIHGHCYGFHLICGGEGSKDVFSALYKFKPTAPHDIFYDFACQLSEYCKNREPQHFLQTRFWHDIFHSFNHTGYGSAFKYSRVKTLEGVNSEICEQFNAYLQCVKFTGSHLSQKHFMMFAQFMVYLWNKQKTQTFKDIVSVALGGVL